MASAGDSLGARGCRGTLGQGRAWQPGTVPGPGQAAGGLEAAWDWASPWGWGWDETRLGCGAHTCGAQHRLVLLRHSWGREWQPWGQKRGPGWWAGGGLAGAVRPVSALKDLQ